MHILTRNWLAQMPETLRPPELVRSFPRIANNLSRLWGQPKDCATYLASLLTDTRNGTRKGFPQGVAAELVALRRQMEILANMASVEGMGITERSTDPVQ